MSQQLQRLKRERSISKEKKIFFKRIEICLISESNSCDVLEKVHHLFVFMILLPLIKLISLEKGPYMWPELSGSSKYSVMIAGLIIKEKIRQILEGSKTLHQLRCCITSGSIFKL